MLGISELVGIRPAVRFLSQPLIEQILEEARGLLSELGIEVQNEPVTRLLLDSGAHKDDSTGRILIREELVELALRSVPAGICLCDREGAERARLEGSRVHFTPGSAAINFLDGRTGEVRLPTTSDYVRYVRLVDQLEALDYQSTAFIPADVHERVSDSYRLYLSLIHGVKPVVTGAFTVEGMKVMIDLLLAVRGDEAALAATPLAIFSCAPTAPLKWSEEIAQNLVDCARYRIPVELISMPLTGFVAPGTLVGTLVQHTAECLSGLVISQLACPGTPVLWGGSPAVFDFRYETTPMGAIETQMVCCAYAEIGKHLGLPTQAYMGLSDSKRVDGQAGAESASGLILAALAGINSISGPGMLDFESCQSLEKLVLDNELCAAARRLAEGVQPRPGDFPSQVHFRELLREGHLLIADHTRQWIRREVRFPGPVIDRAHRGRHQAEGGLDLEKRAQCEVESLLESPPNPIDAERRRRLDEVMLRASRAVDVDRLPSFA